MTKPTFNYDEESDTLYVSFAPGQKATGIELNEHVLLRIDTAERRAVGLTVFDCSVLAQHTEIGPRGFPLTGLSQLTEELREMVFAILLHPPVSDVLSLLAYSPSPSETIPVISLRPLLVSA